MEINEVINKKSKGEMEFFSGFDIYINSANIVFMKKMKGVGFSYEFIKKQSLANDFLHLCLMKLIFLKSLLGHEELYFQKKGEGTFILVEPFVEKNKKREGGYIDFAFYKMRSFLLLLMEGACKREYVVEEFLKFSNLLGWMKTLKILHKLMIQYESERNLINSLLKVLYQKIKIEFSNVDGVILKKMDIVSPDEFITFEFLIIFQRPLNI